MSDAAKGAQRVGSIMSRLSSLGFRCARVSASGQRKGARRDERGIDGDLIALAPPHSGWPHLIVEVGGLGKRVGQSFAEMTEHGTPPGFAPVVARIISRARWRFSIDSDHAFDDLTEALDALRDA